MVKLTFLLDIGYTIRYIAIMKTAISIDEYTPNIITEKLNAYYGNHESKMDDDLKEAAYRLLAREEW